MAKKKQAKAKKQSVSRQQTVNEDLASQQILAQTVVDTVQQQRDRIRELEAEAEKARQEKTRLEAELSVKSKNVETAPQLAGDGASNADVLKYLEEEILPRARTSSFAGAMPVMKNGKLEVRKISNVKELEDLIAELKEGSSQAAVASLPQTNISSGGFLSKLKSLVGG